MIRNEPKIIGQFPEPYAYAEKQMKETILQTQRLFLRKYRPEDHPLLLQLYVDWNWKNVDAVFAEGFLKNVIMKQYETGGGVVAVFQKENDLYMGHCGIKYLETQQEWHLSFRFLKSCWRENYPAEALKACIEHGFHSLNLNEIIVDLEERNKAAAKLLQSLGFRHRINFEENGSTLLRYSIFSR
jgi:RimJ/RimL family protein N-acetyltransferase